MAGGSRSPRRKGRQVSIEPNAPPIFWGKGSLTDKAQYISKLDVPDSAAEILLQDPAGDFQAMRA